jgi:glycosyltransferase involved in cell wall biosynthesis
MESICCGTPVIAFNCCGGPELIDADSGYIVPENDVEELIHCLIKEQQYPLRYNVEEKQKKFDKNLCYQKYISIYKELCAK